MSGACHLLSLGGRMNNVRHREGRRLLGSRRSILAGHTWRDRGGLEYASLPHIEQAQAQAQVQAQAQAQAQAQLGVWCRVTCW